MMPRRAVWIGWEALAAACLLVAVAQGCEQDEPLEVSAEGCPNDIPEDGASCKRAGLVCNYYTGCETYYPASCGDDLLWSFENLCVLPGGGGPGGAGTGGTGTGGTATGGTGTGGTATGGTATGGAGGAGGSAGAGGSG